MFALSPVRNCQYAALGLLCVLKKLGLNKDYSGIYQELMKIIANGKVIIGTPSNPDNHGQASGGYIYINGDIEDIGLLIGVMFHEAAHYYYGNLYGSWEDYWEITLAIQEFVTDTSQKLQSQTIATYHCCGKNNNRFPIAVSAFDLILNECGIDTDDCESRDAVLINTTFP